MSDDDDYEYDDGDLNEQTAMDDDDDSSLAEGDTRPPEEDHDEIEDRRRARRSERQERRERQRLAREKQAQEVRELRETVARLQAQVGSVEQRTVHGQIETGIAKAQEDAEAAKRRYRAAVENGDIDGQLAAQEALFEARQRAADIQRMRSSAAPAAPAVAEQINPTRIRQQAFYDSFVASNAWFDPTGRDEDSRAAIAISNRVAQEGFAAHTPAHWAEINRRLKAERPHLFGGASERPRQPTGGTGRGLRGASSPATSWRTAERLAVLADMGLTEKDPEAKPYIKAYIEYDREHR